MLQAVDAEVGKTYIQQCRSSTVLQHCDYNAN